MTKTEFDKLIDDIVHTGSIVRPVCITPRQYDKLKEDLRFSEENMRKGMKKNLKGMYSEN